MIRKITCIECPNGCLLTVQVENNKAVKITGNKCPKGEKYAITEVENPVRILATSVLAEGLPFKMVSVKTDKPIPKSRTMEAMDEIKKIKVTKHVRVGNVIADNFLGLGVNLVATRGW